MYVLKPLIILLLFQPYMCLYWIICDSERFLLPLFLLKVVTLMEVLMLRLYFELLRPWDVRSYGDCLLLKSNWIEYKFFIALSLGKFAHICCYIFVCLFHTGPLCFPSYINLFLHFHIRKSCSLLCLAWSICLYDFAWDVPKRKRQKGLLFQLSHLELTHERHIVKLPLEFIIKMLQVKWFHINTLQ